LTPGQVRSDVDFGYQGDASVAGLVWYDVDADGTQNHQEPGIPGVTVTLLFGGNDGDLTTAADNITFTTTTDANGNFRFAGLPVAAISRTSPTYRVTTSNVPAAYTTRTFDPDGVGTPDTAAFTVMPAQALTGIGFGYRGSPGTGVGGRVFLDANGDGVQGAGD